MPAISGHESSVLHVAGTTNTAKELQPLNTFVWPLLSRLLAYPGHSLQSRPGISTSPIQEMNGRWHSKNTQSSLVQLCLLVLYFTQGVCENRISAPGGVLLYRKTNRFLGVADFRLLLG